MPRAKKSIHKPEFSLILGLLKDARAQAGLTQAALGAKLGRPQTYVSDCELGVRRLDLLQAYEWCLACGTTLTALAMEIDRTLMDSPVKRALSKLAKK